MWVPGDLSHMWKWDILANLWNFVSLKREGVRLIRWKKGMFLRIVFSDTDSVSLFSQFPYNNATFEKYFPKFLLQNSDKFSLQNFEKFSLQKLSEWQWISGGATKKSCFAVYIITHNRIIWNKKIEMHLLNELFLDVTLGGFFFYFSTFRSTWKPNNRFPLKKSADLLL